MQLVLVSNKLDDQESYEKSIKELGEFKTVQGFWRLYNHLIRPNDLPNTTDYHLFKTGIKPMWEVCCRDGYLCAL
jgi:hypothetical protein